ncbi:hypothetical protein BDA96_08G199500 [Sorghum bicolor]|uniref:Embryo surrounding factor 1 brassicaceae domain-containing protein n=2 Tax=Sorghum bicolor TaxID=4558 RepID=A0A921U7P3_SORBI|nr:hypothetical protein BDA96_08G199500 [Sorghum bicolor]KXG24084.1 hypothetical protein SORBI_3008G182100 [Sorghum bicolor]
MKSCCADLLYVMAILSFVLFVCLPLPSALSKTGDTQTYQNSATNKKLARNTSVPHETKFTVTFCANDTCDGDRDCYCCQHNRNDLCYWTRAECQAECPACAPHCPP